MNANNLFENIPERTDKEDFDPIVECDALKLERIVSQGHADGEDQWCDQARDEWVALLSGRARLAFEADGRVVELRRGDHLVIPAGVRHRVAWTDPDEPTIWLALHYKPN